MMFVSVQENQLTERDKNVLTMLGFPTFVPCKPTAKEYHGVNAVRIALCCTKHGDVLRTLVGHDDRKKRADAGEQERSTREAANYGARRCRDVCRRLAQYGHSPAYPAAPVPAAPASAVPAPASRVPMAAPKTTTTRRSAP